MEVSHPTADYCRLAGETMAARGQIAPAAVALEQAVEMEDRLTYDEPPPWPIPVQAAGALSSW